MTVRRALALASVVLVLPLTSLRAAPEMARALDAHRLDPNVAPTFQEITLDLDADATAYGGSVRIEVNVKRPTRTFRFHAEEMTFERVELYQGDRRIEVGYETAEEGTIHATTEVELQPGAYELQVDFSKDYNTNAVGLYRAVVDGQGYLFTQMEVIDARKAFPCWDEPAYKLPFQFIITIPHDQEVVTNTPVAAESRAGATKTVTFEKTKPLPTYLLAIAAGPLDSVPIEGLSVPGRIYTVKGQSHLADLAAETTAPILAAIEQYFGTPYPFAKLDLIAVPEFWAGAMENAGAITYADRILLVPKETASIRQKRFQAFVHAHEIAHMWFGDYVTMAWWDDLWLNEAFAEWLSAKIVQELYPEYKMELEMLSDIQRILAQDARPSTKSIRQPVKFPRESMEDIWLPYHKGQQVLEMVEAYVGADAFQTGVRDYITKHAWGNATADDLFAALSKASGKDLSVILSTFLDQSGCPLITASLTSDGRLKMTQKRYLNYGVDAPDQLWAVPVRVKYADANGIHEKSVYLDEPETVVTLGTNVKWLLPDADARGYYRWNVPEAMLLEVASDPMTNLNERERTVFLANARALLTAGEMRGDSYLKLLEAYASVPEPEVVEAVMGELGAIYRMFVTPDLRDDFSRYVRNMLRPAYERYGVTPRDGEAPAAAALRPALVGWLGRGGEVPEVRAHCEELIARFMEDPTSVDGTTANAAMRVVAAKGNADLFEALRSKLESATSPNERRVYLSGLASLEDPALLGRALDYAASDEVRGTDMMSVFQALRGNPTAEEIAFPWVMKNYDTIAAKLPEEFVALLVFSARGCSEETLAEAQQFFGDPAHQVHGTMANLARVTDSVTDCVNMRKRDGAIVADYLRSAAAAGQP